MKPLLVFFALVALVIPAALAADQPALDGYWWAKLDASFKLGWVSGYAKAMAFGGALKMATCAANMPMYEKQYPSLDPKDLMEKLCLSDTQFDYDNITMGQFVAGIDAFYRDYRNEQLEVTFAIEYSRDAIKGMPTQELNSEVGMWRRCTAADKSHPMPRSDDDAAQISKACTPDSGPAAK